MGPNLFLWIRLCKVNQYILEIKSQICPLFKLFSGYEENIHLFSFSLILCFLLLIYFFTNFFDLLYQLSNLTSCYLINYFTFIFINWLKSVMGTNDDNRFELRIKNQALRKWFQSWITNHHWKMIRDSNNKSYFQGRITH